MKINKSLIMVISLLATSNAAADVILKVKNKSLSPINLVLKHVGYTKVKYGETLASGYVPEIKPRTLEQEVRWTFGGIVGSGFNLFAIIEYVPIEKTRAKKYEYKVKLAKMKKYMKFKCKRKVKDGDEVKFPKDFVGIKTKELTYIDTIAASKKPLKTVESK